MASNCPPRCRRPASPITFAPDPRHRPISPILFAKSASKTKVGRGAERGVDGSADIHGDDEYGIDDGGVGGYEEDDEWDAADEGADDADDDLGAIYPKRHALHPEPPNLSGSPSQVPNLNSAYASSPDTASKYNTTTSTYTLLRFSTGQKLEDEYQLSWYDLVPHELLELHAHAPVQHLPASFALQDTAPKSSKPTHKFAHHARTNSTPSLSRQPSRLSPNAPADLSPAPPTRTYFPSLNRACLKSYVQPYWEGYVRALRVVLRGEQPTYFPHPSYGFSGGVGEAGIGAFVPALAVMGHDVAGRDVRAMEMKESFGGYGAGYAEMSGRKGRERSGSRSTTLEWRLRWAIVRDGMLYLSKDREVGAFLYIIRSRATIIN